MLAAARAGIREYMNTGFVVAMAAQMAVATYGRPTDIVSRREEWIIVSSWGDDAEFLTIATTGTEAAGDGAAPHGLQPHSTFLGVLLSRGPAGTDDIYLLVRHLPDGISVAGVFFPADGYARVERGEPMRLVAAGRQAHSVGQVAGRELRVDVPHPAPHDTAATAWHISGTERSWMGRFIGDQPGLTFLRRSPRVTPVGIRRRDRE